MIRCERISVFSSGCIKHSLEKRGEGRHQKTRRPCALKAEDEVEGFRTAIAGPGPRVNSGRVKQRSENSVLYAAEAEAMDH